MPSDMASSTLRPPDGVRKLTLIPMNAAAMTLVREYEGAKTSHAFQPGRPLPQGWTPPSWPSLSDGRVWTRGIDIVLPTAATDKDHGDRARNDFIASIGRKGSIRTTVSKISSEHCIFEYVWKSGLVVIRDGSFDHSVQVLGEQCFPITLSDRQVVVHPKFNTFIGIGGSRCDRLCFELVWPQATDDFQNIPKPAIFGTANNDFTTFGASETWDADHHLTRLHLPQNASSTVKCYLQQQIGRGKFSLIRQAIDVHRASYVAVKTYAGEPVRSSPDVMNVDGSDKQYSLPDRQTVYLKREVEAMARIRHPHVVRFLGLTQSPTEIGICMPLQEGTLHSLVRTMTSSDADLHRIACGVLQQMAAALDHMHRMGIVHFDVKPSNILYMTNDESECGYDFSLSDLGCCNRPHQPGTLIGTLAFAGPEVHLGGFLDEKTDIWALYATIVWVLDIDGFRTNCGPCDPQTMVNGMLHTRNYPIMAQLFKMADPCPAERPTARDLCRELFPNGTIEDLLFAMQQDIETCDELMKGSGMAVAQVPDPGEHRHSNNHGKRNAIQDEHRSHLDQPQRADQANHEEHDVEAQRRDQGDETVDEIESDYDSDEGEPESAEKREPGPKIPTRGKSDRATFKHTTLGSKVSQHQSEMINAHVPQSHQPRLDQSVAKKMHDGAVSRPAQLSVIRG